MSNTCGACSERVGARYDAARCSVVLRKFTGYTPIGFHCSVSFTDILDTAALGEWDTLLTAEDILVFPNAGSLEFAAPSNTPVGTDACGNDIAGTDTYAWTYTNPNVDDAYLDEDFYHALGTNFNSYRYGFVRQCDGEDLRLYLNDAAITLIKAGGGAVPTNNPGHEFGITQKPFWAGPNGKGEAGQWSMGGNLKTNHVLRSCPIPGLAEILENY